MRRIAVVLATVFGSGFFPVAPATFASGITVAVVWFFWPVNPTAELALILVLTPLAVWASHLAEKDLGHDAHPIVIDEVVGQLIAVWGMPRELGWMVAGFLLFRFFDIAKPVGIRGLQRFPGGLGIVIDDVVAGLYSWIVLMVAYLIGKNIGG